MKATAGFMSQNERAGRPMAIEFQAIYPNRKVTESGFGAVAAAVSVSNLAVIEHLGARALGPEGR